MRWERYILEEDAEREFPVHADKAGQEPCETNVRIQLATHRADLDSERTLLEWVRTAIFFMATAVGLDWGSGLLHWARVTAGIHWTQTAHLISVSIAAAITLLLTFVACNHLKRARIVAVLAHRTPPRVTPAFVAAVLTVLLGLATLGFLTTFSD